MSNKITNYVLAFLFDETTEKVWLIEKQKPEWQKGCLNGIGGKIEEGEAPWQACIRELKEESGIDLHPDYLHEVGVMGGVNNDGSGFKVHIFTAVTDQKLETKEIEQVGQYLVTEVKSFKHIENVPMLIEACLYKMNGTSNFQFLTMDY